MEPVPGFGLFLVRIFLVKGWEVCSRIWFKVLLQNKDATEIVAILGSPCPWLWHSSRPIAKPFLGGQSENDLVNWHNKYFIQKLQMEHIFPIKSNSKRNISAKQLLSVFVKPGYQNLLNVRIILWNLFWSVLHILVATLGVDGLPFDLNLEQLPAFCLALKTKTVRLGRNYSPWHTYCRRSPKCWQGPKKIYGRPLILSVPYQILNF